MERKAFKMHLHPGQSEEYRRRHDALWPELADLLRSSGIHNYSIFLDEETDTLFGVMEVENPAALDELPKHPIMQRWWAHMSDIMASNPDNSPISTQLKKVFYLP